MIYITLQCVHCIKVYTSVHSNTTSLVCNDNDKWEIIILAYMYVMTEGTKLHGIVFNKDLDKHWVMVTVMVYKLILPSFECVVQWLVFPVHCLMITVSLSLSLFSS